MSIALRYIAYVHVHFMLCRFVALACHSGPKEVRQLTACAGLPLALELAMLSVLALVRTAPLLLVGAQQTQQTQRSRQSKASQGRRWQHPASPCTSKEHRGTA